MGSLDSNNIYIYDETDIVSPLHSLLNLGQASVGPAIKAMGDKWEAEHDAPFRLWVGQTSFENTATHPHTTITVPFPTGRFTQSPAVFLQPFSPRGGQFRVTARLSTILPSQCQISVGTIISGSQSFPIEGWINILAIQMNESGGFG